MANYQLYHTNVYLGGQMKYNLILSSHENDLVISDFHITPISPFIPFNKYAKENLLNYTHQENIKGFYKQISSRFYDQCVDPMLESPYPIMSEYSGKLYDDTYEMGCRRMSYKLYNRQFEFLCPLWLENIDEDEYLNFEFSIYLKGKESSSNILAKKNVILKPQTGCIFHNNFIEYLNNYLDYIGIRNNGVDSVFNIDPIKQISVVDGINVETGLNQVKQLPHLLTNLFTRELPLMEFDNTIIHSLQDNKLITKQLFNFNLCFNPNQLIPDYLLKMVGCSNFIIKLNVAVEKEVINENGEPIIHSQPLEIRDIYSNYEYIPKKYCDENAILLYNDGSIKDVTDDYKRKLFGIVDENTEENTFEPNVLDYLNDYKCIDYINKNKITQPIIHWSLNDNNDYIFNVYNGFGGYHLPVENISLPLENKKLIQYVSHKYDNTPNLKLDHYIPSQNTNCWCNSIIIDVNNDINSKSVSLDESHLKNLISYYSKLHKNGWNNGIKNPHEDVSNYNILIIGAPYIVVEQLNFEDKVKWTNEDGIGVYYFFMNGQHYINFIIRPDNDNTHETTVNKMRKLTFIKALSILEEIESDDSFTSEIKSGIINILNNIKNDTDVIIIPSTLEPIRVDTQVLETSEILYTKSNKPSKYVERYFGKIKPTFIDPLIDKDFNYKYERIPRIIDGVENTEIIAKINRYSNYLKEPYYPSIGYFFMDKHKEKYEGENRKGVEINSFNYNIIRNFEPVLNWTLYQPIPSDKDEKNYKKINELVREELCRFYIGDNSQPNNQELLDYIMSIYEYNSSFDYRSESDIYNYRYDIKLTLK